MNLTVLVTGGFLIDQTAENILRHSFQIADQDSCLLTLSVVLYGMVVFVGGDSGGWW